VLKVKEYVFPLERVPESNAPEVEVTVCGALSALVQVTVVPLATVRVAGLKAKLAMFMLAVEAAGGVEVEGVDGAVVEGVTADGEDTTGGGEGDAQPKSKTKDSNRAIKSIFI
jgi:hypothetical protein